MDSNNRDKVHRRKPKERKPYERPAPTMFKRITDSFKSILNPLTRGWLIGTDNEYETLNQTMGSSTHQSDEKASNQMTLKKAESQNGMDDDIQSEQEVDNQKVERSSLDEDQSKRFKLWSDKVSSSKLQHPAVKKRQFTPTSFGVLQEKRLLNRSTSSNKSLQSPFYPGRTEFGGNNSVLTPNSFSMPRVKRVEVMQNKKRRIADTSVERISSFDTLNKSTKTPISSTAKKIMRTLETFSSPLSDAKKIPLSQREPTFYSAIRKRRRAERRVEAKKKPPVSTLNVSTKAQTISSNKTSLNSSLLSYSNPTVKETASASESSKPPVTSQATVAYNSSTQGGGKMKNRRRAHASSAGVTNEEEQPLEQIDLPNVVLPIDVKSLPSFFLEKPASTSTPSAKSTNKPAATSKPTFSKPLDIKKKVSKPSDEESTSEMSFSFSSPKPIQTTSKVKKLFAEEPQFKLSSDVTESTNHGDNKPKSDESSTKLFSFDKKNKPSSSVEADISKEIAKKPKAFGFDKPAATAAVSSKRWECQTCMVRNEESKQVCVACTVPREGKIQPKPVSKQTTLSFTTSSSTMSKLPQTNPIKFGLTKENEEISSPPATSVSESPKPIMKMKKPSDIWMCSVCLIKNQKSSTKCIACETPNPEANKQVTFGDKSFEYTSSSILKVDTKKQDTTKQVASSEKAAESSKPSLDFTFSSTTSTANTSNAAATSKPSAFTGTFGAPLKSVESNKQTATPLSAIQFGVKSSSDDSKPKSTGFSFGITSSNKPVEFGIKPTETPATTTKAGFKFGVQSTVSTETSKPALSHESVMSVLSKPSTTTSEPTAAPATTSTSETTGVSQPATQKPSELSSSAPKSTEKGFVFASKPAEPASNQPASTSGFNFTSSSSSSKPAGFNFGQKPVTSSAASSMFSSNKSLNFQPANTSTGGFLTKPSQPETTSAGGFLTKPSQPQTTSAGGFFSKPSQPETTSAGGFLSKPSQPQTTSAGVFFSKPSQPQTTSAGGFFSKPSQPETTSAGGFFSKPSQPETTSAGGFFSKPSQPQTTSASGFMFSKPSQPQTTSASGFMFSKPSQPQTTSAGGFMFSKPSQPSTTSASGFMFSASTPPAASNSMFSASSATNTFQSNSEAKPFSITNPSKQPETDSSKLFAAPSTSLFGNPNPPMFSNQSSGIFGAGNNSTNKETAWKPLGGSVFANKPAASQSIFGDPKAESSSRDIFSKQSASNPAPFKPVTGLFNSSSTASSSTFKNPTNSGFKFAETSNTFNNSASSSGFQFSASKPTNQNTSQVSGFNFSSSEGTNFNDKTNSSGFNFTSTNMAKEPFKFGQATNNNQSGFGISADNSGAQNSCFNLGIVDQVKGRPVRKAQRRTNRLRK